MRRARIVLLAWVTLASLGAGWARGQAAPPARHLTLDQALALARAQNKGLRMATLEAAAQHTRIAQARADAFPELAADASQTHLTKTQAIVLPAGSLGAVDATAIPVTNVAIAQGTENLFIGTATVRQPITQLIRIAAGTRAAAAGAHAAAAHRRDAELQVVYGVEQLYTGLLLAVRRRETDTLGVVAAELTLRDAQAEVRAGNALAAAEESARATLFQRQQDLLAADNQVDDNTTDLNDALGLPLETPLALDSLPPAPPEERPVGDEVATAVAEHPEVQVAVATVEGASAGLSAARSAYIPDVGVFGQYVHQSNLPFLPRDNVIVGIKASWPIFNFGKRESAIAERQDELAEARVNVDRVRDQVSADVEKAYRQVERAQRMQHVADAALVAQTEASRLLTANQQAGATTIAEAAEARFQQAHAETNALQAALEYRLALAQLARATGARR
jgi:outer membrane protein